MVLDESEYEDKLNAVLESGVYEPDSQGRQESTETHFERQNFSFDWSKSLTCSISQQTSTPIWSSPGSQTWHSSEAYSEK
jgi:hypothetical protein